jgi:hypothetical protein
VILHQWGARCKQILEHDPSEVESVAAAPGVFFVFRDEQLRETFAAA